MSQEFWDKVKSTAKANRKKIGIGIKTMTPQIRHSLDLAQEYVDVKVFDNFEELVQAAKDKGIDGMVRGNFDAVEAYNAVKKILAHAGPVLEANFYKLNGVNLVDPDAKGVFCILPVSFTNERNLEDKIKSIDLHLELFRELELTPKIGVLGPGKPEDISANVPEVTEGLKEAQQVVDLFQNRNISAKYFNHQIEKAVLEANIIVAPNSWAGNLAAHCLLYLGSCDYLGGVALNIRDIIYVDDSEAMENFTNCLILSAYLAVLKQNSAN